jgi:riboflavin kinase/FMN adenylyltransferase
LKVTWGLENASYNPRTITTLGSYDGMHRGHVEILNRLTNKQAELGLARSIVLTFDPHPQEVLQKNNTSIGLLTTIDERLSLLEKTGVDETLVIRFSHEFAIIPYNDFFRDILVKKIGTSAMVVGFNHAFGKNREGDIDHLKALASGSGVTVEEVAPLIINGISISSTKIRHAITNGNISIANDYLGRPYELTGIVVQGDKLGRTLGYPTANLIIHEHKLVPGDGVYAGSAFVDGIRYNAAISIGTRPSINDLGQRVIEAYLLDFDQNLYNKQVRLQFHSFLRPQKKFDSLDALKEQITDDIENIRTSVI